MAREIRILIVDDHTIIRQGLRLILRVPRAVFGEGNMQEALEQAAKQRWDVVLLDITMPGKAAWTS